MKNLRDLRFSDRDEFDRKKIAENLLYGLNDDKIKLSPILLDGSWGTGKTEFIMKFMNYVRDFSFFHYDIYYINAFDYDYLENPLIALISVLLKDRSKNSDLWITGTQVISNIVTALSPSPGVQISASIANQIVQNIHEQPSNIKKLQRILSKRNERTLVIIDELDRCKPDFALRLIETTKHLFDLNNFYFIFVANKKTLEHSIKHHYGLTPRDATKYFFKYIRHTFSLPSIHINTEDYYRLDSEAFYFIKKIEEYNLKDIFYYFDYASEICSRLNLSFRDIEQLVQRLAIVSKYTKEIDLFDFYTVIHIIFGKTLCDIAVSIMLDDYDEDGGVAYDFKKIGLLIKNGSIKPPFMLNKKIWNPQNKYDLKSDSPFNNDDHYENGNYATIISNKYKMYLTLF